MPDATEAPNLYAQLIADHRALYAVLEHLAALRDHDEDQADRLLAELEQALWLHARAEEAVVYPRLGALGQGATEEHEVGARLLAEVARMRAAGEDWRPGLAELRRSLVSHMEREESELFPALRERLGDDDGALAGEFAAARERLARG